ncbi:MAG: LacI family DNA-binding transcriptional regulator [Candidatus Margulisiibacteriota bacterium]
MPTQKEIAKKCGVSVAAVSAAFKRPKHLSKETREKILAAARDLGYLAARFEIKNIGLAFDGFRNHFLGEYYNEIIYGILERLKELGLRAQIFEKIPEKYQEICELSGFLVIGNDSTHMAEDLERHGIPYILVECTKGLAQKHPHIYFDNLPGVEQLVEYVINCGHQHLAILNGETDPQDIFWKNFQAGVKKMLLKNRLPLKNLTIFQADYNNLDSVDIGVNRLLSKHKKISCIMCSNDLFAYAAALVLAKNKVRVPQDISLTGFDGIAIPRHLKTPAPNLTTVFADRIKLGRDAVDYLLEVIQNPKDAPPKIAVETRLRVGETVRRVK